MSGWTVADIPDLSGWTVLVTGVTGGLGANTARELATHGAHVVLGARSFDGARGVGTNITESARDASWEVLELDLADLRSVRDASRSFGDRHSALDLLVNNAGVMATPERRTADGFELQLGTNHLGPFALTGLLTPQLLAAPNARVVTVSSIMHKYARRVPTLDPREPRRYRKWQAYSESKLANLLFAFELDRRAAAAGAPITSVAAHPGVASTHLQRSGPELAGRTFGSLIVRLGTMLFAQSADAGAWPLLYAATTPGLAGGSYVGPEVLELRGSPRIVTASRAAYDLGAGRRLWNLSEQATGVVYPF